MSNVLAALQEALQQAEREASTQIEAARNQLQAMEETSAVVEVELAGLDVASLDAVQIRLFSMEVPEDGQTSTDAMEEEDVNMDPQDALLYDALCMG